MMGCKGWLTIVAEVVRVYISLNTVAFLAYVPGSEKQ